MLHLVLQVIDKYLGVESQIRNCQAQGPDQVQVDSRRLQGLKKLKDILKSQGLDLENMVNILQE